METIAEECDLESWRGADWGEGLHSAQSSQENF